MGEGLKRAFAAAKKTREKRDFSAAIEARAEEMLKLLQAQSPLSVPQYVFAQAIHTFVMENREAKKNEGLGISERS